MSDEKVRLRQVLDRFRGQVEARLPELGDYGSGPVSRLDLGELDAVGGIVRDLAAAEREYSDIPDGPAQDLT